MGSGRFLALMHSFRRINTPTLARQPADDLDQGLEPSFSGRDCTHEADHLLTSFDADLALRIQQLQLQGEGSAHLNWLLDACSATLSTHSSLGPLLHHCTAPTFFCGQRADEVLSLLDLCSSLKQIANDVYRQLALLQRALNSTADQALHTPKQSAALQQSAIGRFQACLHGLQLLDSKHYTPLAEAHAALRLASQRVLQVRGPPTSPNLAATSLNGSLDGTLLISLLLLASTLSSFAMPPKTSRSISSLTQSVCKLIARYISKGSSSARSGGGEAAWVAPLHQLQQDLKQEQMSCAFLELQRLHASASSLHNAFVIMSKSPCSNCNDAQQQLRQTVGSLRKSCQEAQACMSALVSHLASLFQALLKLRLDLLK